jgi:hypothetical protein
MARPLFRPRTNHTCHQKPNPSRETGLLKKEKGELSITLRTLQYSKSYKQNPRLFITIRQENFRSTLSIIG